MRLHGSARSAADADAGLEATKQAKSICLDEAEENAQRIFDELWVNYLREYHAKGEEAARQLAEEQVPAKYDELRNVVAHLLPRMSYSQMPRCACPSSTAPGREYDVIEFNGKTLPPSALEKCFDNWEKLAYARKTSDEDRARIALVGALATLSSRSQNCWLDATLPESEWEARQEGEPKEKHQAIFEEWVKEALAEKWGGYFSNALMKTESKFRLAFAIGEAWPRPASLLVTISMPLVQCFKEMDGGGPLRGTPSEWRRWPHFALQDLCAPPEGKKGTRYERRATSDLKHEPAIRDLIRSGSPVIMLDGYAALAPRADCRKYGLSDIVREEFTKLLRDAKARGQAVVFMLGGDDEPALAQKVYLKPPFIDYGLRIGHLRWKEAVTECWAREKRGDDRLYIGLQLP